jgi:hypothetical protein
LYLLKNKGKKILLIILIKDILDKIKSLQVSDKESVDYGLFLSVRENKLLGYSRTDNTIFSSLSILYILQSLVTYFDEEEHKLYSEIKSGIWEALKLFKNKDRLNTYNFWKTQPSQHFPNGKFAQKFKHFKLPDDVDDTALAYLCFSDQFQVSWLIEKLEKHADPQKRIYSTWFGEKIIFEQDVCALSNLLLCLGSESDLELDDLGTNSLKFIKKVVLEADFLNNSFKYSRHYAQAELIIYHATRLFTNPKYYDVKVINNLKHSIEKFFKIELNPITKVLLLSSYLKMGGNADRLFFADEDYINSAVSNSKSYYSFIGALLGPYESKVPRFLVESKFTRINWKCEALEWAHVLEFMILNNVK